MTAAILNNSGNRNYPADIAGMVISAEKTATDLFLNCFAAAGREEPEVKTKFDSTALLDIQDINQSLDGDNEAYKRLIERHQGQISKLMWRFSRDRVVHEELVQDVFVQVYMSLHTYKRKAPFQHWLNRIATRVGFGYWKKKARQNRIPTVSIEDYDQAALNEGEDGTAEEVAEMLHNMLGKLSVRDRLVLTLRYLEQNNIEQTAELTGWSIPMVKVQTWRAKRKFKKLYEDFTGMGGD